MALTPGRPGTTTGACLRGLAFASLLQGAAPTEAASWLDGMREIDLNDYALGIAVTGGNNRYADTPGSRFLYPYLTSLEDSTLTEHWLVVEGAGVRGRRVTGDGRWEFGLGGRLQTLGFGPDPGDALAGMEPVGWTLEAGPSVGWRGGPVQVQLRHDWELLGRHAGTTQELRLSLPRELPRGYLVPWVALVRQDARYADHYFGVAEEEATDQRAAYRPGEAVNLHLGVRAGYRPHPNWLVSGSLALELMDDAVTDSPLVDDAPVASATLGVAYNRGPFRPRTPPKGAPDPPRWGVSVTFIDAEIDGSQRVDGRTGRASTLDLESDLGQPEEDELVSGRIVRHFGHYHRLQFEYLQVDRRGNVSLPSTARFGDLVLDGGTSLRSETLLRLPSINYGYAILRDEQKELGATLGFHVPSIDLRIESADGAVARSVESTHPLPVLGAYGRVRLRGNLTARARAQIFRLDIDRYDGAMTLLEAGLDYEFGRHGGVGLGWAFYRLNLNASESDFSGRLKVDYQGPQLTAGLRF
jgi:outer membrane protein